MEHTEAYKQECNKFNDLQRKDIAFREELEALCRKYGRPMPRSY
jgi:hypothetical protein